MSENRSVSWNEGYRLDRPHHQRNSITTKTLSNCSLVGVSRDGVRGDNPAVDSQVQLGAVILVWGHCTDEGERAYVHLFTPFLARFKT